MVLFWTIDSTLNLSSLLGWKSCLILPVECEDFFDNLDGLDTLETIELLIYDDYSFEIFEDVVLPMTTFDWELKEVFLSNWFFILINSYRGDKEFFILINSSSDVNPYFWSPSYFGFTSVLHSLFYFLGLMIWD